MADMIDELIAREDAEDPEAASFTFRSGRRRRVLRATSLEGGWRALGIAVGEEQADRWSLVEIDGQMVPQD